MGTSNVADNSLGRSAINVNSSSIFAPRQNQGLVTPGVGYAMSFSLSFEHDAMAQWAGLGLRSFPLMYQPLEGKEPENWWMGPAEQIVSMALLQSLRPKVAIEIGTFYGGFLTMLSTLP